MKSKDELVSEAMSEICHESPYTAESAMAETVKRSLERLPLVCVKNLHLILTTKRRSKGSRTFEVTSVDTGKTRVLSYSECVKHFGRDEFKEILAGHLPHIIAVEIAGKEKEMNDAWGKLWDLAAGESSGPAIIHVDPEDCSRVVLEWSDGSKGVWFWDDGDWQSEEQLNTAPCDVRARDSL